MRLGRGVDIMAGPGLDTELEQLLGEEAISWGVMVQVSWGWAAGHVISTLPCDRTVSTQLHRSHHIRYAHVVHDALCHVMNVGCTVYVTQLYIDILFDTTPYPLLPHAPSPFHVSTLHRNTSVPDINILRIHDK